MAQATESTASPSPSDLLTVSEVARILRVDDTTVRRWIKQGALDAIQLPHINERTAYRVKRETIDKLLGHTPSTGSGSHGQ